MRALRSLTVLSLLAACPYQLGAAVITLSSNLDGAQAGTGSPGTGFATVTIDDVAKNVFVDLSYSGLGSPTTNAHIHCCVPSGVNAGVIIPFIPAGFVTGATSGTFQSLFQSVSDANLAGIENGLAYINIHTTAFPAGEIRGQIVPEPETFGLIGVGLAGVVALRRRFRVRG